MPRQRITAAIARTIAPDFSFDLVGRCLPADKGRRRLPNEIDSDVVDARSASRSFEWPPIFTMVDARWFWGIASLLNYCSDRSVQQRPRIKSVHTTSVIRNEPHFLRDT
jgi:hypothetical protein